MPGWGVAAVKRCGESEYSRAIASTTIGRIRPCARRETPAAQRGVTANRAPSATNAPAKTRRIQVSTAGRETTCRRTDAANSP